MSEPAIYRSIYPPPHISTNLSLSQFLTLYNPDSVPSSKIILEDDWTGKSVTYCGLRDNASRYAWTLKEKFGLRSNSVVAISGSNSVDHVQLIHAVMWSGATAALINALSTGEDFVHYFEICQPELVFVDASLLETANSALSKIPSLRAQVVVLGACGTNLLSFPRDFETTEKAPMFDLSNFDNREHTAIVCFSSGTSGLPKGVELSDYSLIASLSGIRSSDPIFYNSESRGVFFAPLCHIYGLNTVALMSTWLGAYVMLMRQYNLPSLLRLSSQIKANTLRIVPPIALALAKSNITDTYDLSSVKYIMCSGAALKEDIIESLQTKFNHAPIFQGYGMTETNIATLRVHESHRVGSVGRLFANVEARLVDDDLNDVIPGKEGEMLVRGPTVFRRYMRDPKSTAETMHQGWMRTGDVLRADEDGFLYLTDRKKELIKYKGFQVPPAELEGILNSHPYVSEGAVCAAWDEEQGTEVPMAYITLSESGIEAMQLTVGEGSDPISFLATIRAFVDAKVAGYKKLRGGVHLIASIPKTASGKMLRRLLPVRLERERAKILEEEKRSGSDGKIMAKL